MATNWKRNEKADQAERDVATYLNALGYLTVPAIESARSGAPMVGSAKPLVMPDILGLRAGAMDAFEVKWKKHAEPRRTHGGDLYTGIDRFSYDHYRRFQAESKHNVFLVFLHEDEDEVRCASLDDLDFSCHRPSIDCTQAQFPQSKGGMRNYWYRKIPLWMRYSELRSFVEDYRDCGRLTWPIVKRESALEPKPIPQPKQTSLLLTDVLVEDRDRGYGPRRGIH